MKSKTWFIIWTMTTLLPTGCIKQNPMEPFGIDSDTSSSTSDVDTDSSGPDSIYGQMDTATTTDTSNLTPTKNTLIATDSEKSIDSETALNSNVETESNGVAQLEIITDTGPDIEIEPNNEIDTRIDEGSDLSSESDTAVDNIPDTVLVMDTNQIAEIDTCTPGSEVDRICDMNGNVEVVDNCGNNIKSIQCASLHGRCNQGICGCEPGWTSVNCDRCLVYVKGDIGHYLGHDGRAWEMAVETVQDALDISKSGGCEIWVAQGTYLPTFSVDAAAPRTATFHMIAGVDMYGGFTGNEVHRTDRNFELNPTILSGDIGITGDISDNVYHVVKGAVE